MEPIENKPNKDINRISTPPKEKIILTGDRPTGKFHVDHYVGSLKHRVELQNSSQHDDIFIMVADTRAPAGNTDNPEKVRQNVIEVTLDYLSCDLDPSKSTLFIQSQIPELIELASYYMNLVIVSRMQKNPTVKSEIKMRSFGASIPAGFFTYLINQVADITVFKTTMVPVGKDQPPMIEQTREVVRSFSTTYGEALVGPDVLLPDSKAYLRLPGTDGKTKMGKSLDNCVYLSDTPEDVKKRVISMLADFNRLRVEGPGQIKGNPVFTYLDVFCNDGHSAAFWPDYSNLNELKIHYTKGDLDDIKVKRLLDEVLQAELEPIHARRKESERDIPGIYEILRQGNLKAKEAAVQTSSDVKNTMKINYLEDTELINSQTEKFGE